VRFYVPEWEDHVDANYDFVHDEHSAIGTRSRETAYIWDIFDRESVPVDGVLISREQVDESSSKSTRLAEHGVYASADQYEHDGGALIPTDEGAEMEISRPNLQIPDWLPTISDCGAWGYKSLPFPPYGNDEMLEFYETLGVTTGVTIDHLVLGSGHTTRLYLDERAFTEDFTPDDLSKMMSDDFANEIDVMIDAWPSWPPYVAEYEPSIVDAGTPAPFDEALFSGDTEEVLNRLIDDSRAVYRDDDMRFRYELTLDNAAEMYERYEAGDYSFRLMAAVQGWDAGSYVKATDTVLNTGYQYIGIGGVAGSPEATVETVVDAIGNTVTRHERTYNTRVNTHIFGFAKTGAFGTIGRSGIASFDSASMLRAAWTGGNNYHLDSERRYDAIRVRYPSLGAELDEAIETALRSQEMLYALRAFDANESIAKALRRWHESATRALDDLCEYLEEHRWDDCYDRSRLNDLEEAFRTEYEYCGALKASFSDQFRRHLLKLLREDDPENPVSLERYANLIEHAETVFDDRFPTLLDEIEHKEAEDGDVGTLDQLKILLERYVEFTGDQDYLSEYERTLEAGPWTECDCRICDGYGIEVAIFRGNNRNRRRGFHNTRRFYDQVETELPQLLVVTGGSAALSNTERIEEYLADERPTFWRRVHDLPVAEVGVITAGGVSEWWEPSPTPVSLDPDRMDQNLVDDCLRYQEMFVDSSTTNLSSDLERRLQTVDCTLNEFEDGLALRRAVLDRLGYETLQSNLSEF
jgi:hypothetical protein